MRKVWIVVANASISKVYTAETTKHLVEVKTLTHPESKMDNHELVTDKPGKATELKGAYPHALAPKTWPKLHEKDVFAEELADFLEKGYNEGSFERLYLIASVQFGGLLRHHLTTAVEKSIYMEIQKDLTLMKPEEIRQYLPPVL